MKDFLWCIMFICLYSPAYADGTNGGTERGSVSVTIDNAVMCDLSGCLTNDNEVVEPVLITENGAVYAY